MALVAGEFYSGGRVVDKYGRDSLKAETAGSALSAGDYKSGGRVHDADGRLVVVVETLNAAATAGSIKSGGRLFDDKGRLIIATATGALSAGELLSGGEITDAQGRVVVTNQTLDTALGATEYDSGGAARSLQGRRLVAGASSAFSPLSIAGLLQWAKADAGTSTITDGVAISQWDDQSGNANHLVQATGTKQPLYKAAIQNGLPVVRFDGTDDFLQKAFTLTQPSTRFLVGAYRSAFVSEAAMADGAASAFSNYFARIGSGQMRAYAGVSLDSGTGLTPQSWHVYSVIYNGASSQMWVDGASAAGPNAIGAGNAGGLTLGATQAGANPGAVDIGEDLVYSGALSTTDRQALETYLKRWGTP